MSTDADEQKDLPAIPPVIDPARWDDFEAFRETFLANFTVRKHNTALRAMGDLLRSLIFEADVLSRPSGSGLHHQLRAVVGDLRYLQGFLGLLGDPNEYFPDDPEERPLCRLVGRKGVALGKIADSIEQALSPVPPAEKGPFPNT